MKRPLACADFTFPLLSHDQSLDLIASLGFDGVDIGLFEKRSHLWPSREFRAVNRSARMLARKVRDRGLRVADVFLQVHLDCQPYAINHPQPGRRRKARDWFRRTLDYAGRCGAKHVTALPGACFEGVLRRESLARAADELNWRVDKAAMAGIVFGVEPHIGSIAPNPRAALKLLNSVPGLTLTLDYTHFTRIGVPDIDVEPLIRHASHFHVRGARKGKLQASFKDNTIDYRRVVRKMNEMGYQGWLGIEYVWIDWEYCNECDNLSETIQYRDYCRGLMK